MKPETTDTAELPPLPKPNANGNYPAIEYARVSLARSFIHDRRALGLTQQQLARMARVRLSTISRLESGNDTADLRTMDKVCNALESEQRRQTRKSRAVSKKARS